MGARGDLNLGQLVRESFSEDAYLIGFGTYQGSVAAASSWGEKMRVMQLPAAPRGSYEWLFHASRVGNFLLPLRSNRHQSIGEELARPRPQRGVGVVYDPLQDQRNYFLASLTDQFDEYIWIDHTRAVEPVIDAPRHAVVSSLPLEKTRHAAVSN
jgi:protein-L-isoaspartate(D-aspartate) O-methyltransferase